MRPSEALATRRDEVLAVLKQHRLDKPRIFGSVARGEDQEGSDLDLLVDPNADMSYFDLFQVEDELAEMLGVPVELHTMREFSSRSAARVTSDMRLL